MHSLALTNAQEAEREAGRARAQMQRLQSDNDRLTNEVDAFRVRLNEMRARSENTEHSRVLVNEIHAKVATRAKRINELSDKNYQMTTKHFKDMYADCLEEQ
jgi:hypothetical protein